MKKTIYFKNQQEMLDYYGGEVSNIPSNTLAIVADEDDFVLFSTSNNQSMNGSMKDQGGYIDNISGYAYVTTNGDHDISSYAMVNVNVPQSGGETITQKNAAWQTKWAPALSTMAAGLYAQDPSYGQPQITSPSGWCVQTALDGNAAMSELIALDSLWIEIFGYGSNLHEQYVQIFTQMGLTLDSDGNLVSTDDDKILPFDVDEAIVTNLTGVLGFGCLGGKKISSLNGGIENAKWNYYGTVFNGTGFDYEYIGQFDRVVDQLTMVDQMRRDGITFISNIPAVNQNTLHHYLESFQLDGTVIPNGTNYVTSNGLYDISSFSYVDVNVSAGGGGTAYTFTDISSASDYYTVGAHYEMSGEIVGQGTVTAEDCKGIGISTDYAGYYLYSLSKRTILYTDEPVIANVFFLSQNSLSLPGNGIDNVIVRGTFLVSAMGTNLFILNELAGLCNVGGNLSYTITENRTGDFYDVSAYAYVYVDVPTPPAPTPAPTFMSVSDILNSSTNLTGITTLGRYTSGSPYNYLSDANNIHLNINGGPDGLSKVRMVIYGDYEQDKQLFTVYSYLIDD